MKRFIVLFLVVVFIPCLSVHGQVNGTTPLTPMFTFDAALNSFMETTEIERVIHYGQILKDNIEQIKNLEYMVDNAVKQVEMVTRNIASARDIKSWDDFADWYNRQLYYEKMAVEAATNINVTIGKKDYSIYDLEGIIDGVDDTYVQYWKKEFTEEQRKAMWLELGLSPENYAYVQPFRLMARENNRLLLTASEIQNRKNTRDSERNNEIQNQIAHNASLPENEQMGQNAVSQLNLEVSIQISEKLSDMAAMQALQMKAQGIDRYLDQTPANVPMLSDWPEDGFTSIPKNREK
jgi:hypothetical protein